MDRPTTHMNCGGELVRVVHSAFHHILAGANVKGLFYCTNCQKTAVLRDVLILEESPDFGVFRLATFEDDRP